VIAFTVADHIVAAIAAAAAGAVNAIAGGGSLISFPTLVALGASRVSANVTNTVALCPGYFDGAIAQRSQLPGQRDRLVRLSIAAGLGIALLAVLGLVIDESLPRLNALKQVLALVINVVAACFFAGS
jgi:uncharacterized membrane protein YfcA